MEIPESYRGREQSYLKHRVLREYLVAWGMKLGSLGRRRRVRLCYIDGFAGPWKAKSAALDDTSIAIGLDALRAAATTWQDNVEIEAYFVEKDAAAFGELSRFLESRQQPRITTRAHHGEFGAFVGELERWLASDAAFVFVDPTGWKGAAMDYIAPLVRGQPYRDVLINVMFDHINRFKDDRRRFLREQMRDFFGLSTGDLPESLDEEQLFALYRKNLKERCGLRYAADLAIPHPTDDRTKFRLVVGGSSPKVLKLFRDIEARVIGREAAPVREGARVARIEERTGQGSLFATPPALDRNYESLHADGLERAGEDVLAHLRRAGKAPFSAVWPEILESRHITKAELGRVVWQLRSDGALAIANLLPRQNTARDEHLLVLP